MKINFNNLGKKSTVVGSVVLAFVTIGASIAVLSKKRRSNGGE